MSKPFFSVIIPTYNRAAFIRQAVDSVLAQTFSDWELIVVDDASTDETAEMLAGYSDPHIRVVRNEVNRERSYSRNLGIELASGMYICFLDSDDYYLPNHLQVVFDCISRDNSNGVIGEYHCLYTGAFHEHNSIRTKRIGGDWFYSVDDHEKFQRILTHQPYLNSVVVSKAITVTVSFDVTRTIAEDLDFLLRSAKFSTLRYLDEITTVRVRHSSNTFEDFKDYLTPQIEFLETLRTRHFDEYKIDSNLLSKMTSNLIYRKYEISIYRNSRPLSVIMAGFRLVLLKPFRRKSWKLLYEALKKAGLIIVR